MLTFFSEHPAAAIIGLGIIGTTVAKFFMWIGNVNSDREMFKKFMEEIRASIEGINNLLNKMNPELSRLIGKVDSATKESSPVALTEKGERISEALEAKKWASEIADELYGQAIGKQEYEVYGLCEKYINGYQFTVDQERKIAEVSYQNAVSTVSVLDVLIVELRDALLSMHGVSPE